MTDLQVILKRAEVELAKLKGENQPKEYIVFRNVKFKADAKTLDDYQQLKKNLKDLAEDAGLVCVAGVWKKFKPQGVTGLILLETSHVAIHTWPEDGVGYLTLASCNAEVKPDAAIKGFLKKLGGNVVEKVDELDPADPRCLRMVPIGTEGKIAVQLSKSNKVVESARAAVSLFEMWKQQVTELGEQHENEEETIKAFFKGLPALAQAASEELTRWIAGAGVEKKLSDKEKRECDEETERIRENREGPEAQKSHKFRPAKFTHPNGHPRCSLCGNSERVGGECSGYESTRKQQDDVWSTTRKVQQAAQDILPHVLGRTKFVLEDVVVWSKQLLSLQPAMKAKFPVLRVPDPPYLISRLKGGSGAGVLSTLPRTSRIGVEQALVNELKGDKYDSIFAWAIVKQGESKQVGEFSKTSEFWDSVDEATRKKFDGKRDIFFLPLELVEAFDTPMDLGKIAGRRFGPDVEIKEESPTLNVDPNILQEWPDDRLDAYRKELETFFVDARGAEREATLNAAFLLKHEWERRGISRSFKGTLGEAMIMLAKMLPDGTGYTAPANPSGEEKGEAVSLEEVLRHVKPICLRNPVVALVGGVANQGHSKNDVDILIRGPLDDQTKRAIEFRIGRMFPPEISQRIQFLSDEMGGPFTNNVELYDLWLVPRSKFEIKEMSLDIDDDDRSVLEEYVVKEILKADPLLDYPKGEIGKHESTLQMHFRGASMHGDFRAMADGHLIGYTLAFQKKGLPDVDTIPQAQTIARQFDVDGSAVNKSFRAPKSVWSTPKAVAPKEWLRIAPKKFEAGEVGATTEEEGVMVEVDRPMVEWGIQKPDFHEYFLTKARNGLEGILSFRLLTGERGASAEEVEAGRATRAGEPFWTSKIGTTFLPSVLRRRAVETKSMPPDGQSAMPLSLMKVTPEEFRFWKHKGAMAHEVRDALVESRFFTELNVKMVNGEFARVETKMSLHLSDEMYEIVKVDEVPYTLSYQWWKGQDVVSAGPSREEWHLTLDRGDGVESLALQNNPLDTERTSGIKREYNGKALLTHEGDVDPGKAYDGDVLNPTKDTPSMVRVVDSGKISLLEDSDQFKKIAFTDGKLKGTFALKQEAGDLWVLEPSSPSGKPDGRSMKDQIEKTVWGSPAGKKRLAPMLVKLLPQHKTYVEPFVGSGDYSEVVKKYDSASTFFFFDPPYPGYNSGVGEKEFDEPKFLALLKSLKGKFVITYGVRGGARRKFTEAGFNVRSVRPIRDIRQGVGGAKVLTTLIISNFKQDIGKDADWELIEEPMDIACRVEPEAMHFTSDWNPEILKAVPTRDDIQIWDQDKKDPDVDRTELRPLAFFQPMKPADRPTNDFKDIEDALQHFATHGSLAVGVAVEPKWNGFRVVVEKKGDRVLIYTEDKWRDMSHLLPSVTKEVKSIDGDFILDAELLAFEKDQPLPRRDLARFRGKEPVDDSGVRLRVFHALWLPKDGNITAVHYDDMRKQLSAWFKGKRLKHLEESPYKVARNGKQLRDLMVTWAAKQPGSEGAMLKQLTSTYTLGGQSSSWAKWKLTRLIRAIVYDRHPVKGSLGVFNFFCAVGPVSKPEEWKETVEVNGKTYTVIGKTGNAKIAAKKGDTIVAEIFELLHEAEPDEKKRLHWFGPPMVVSKTNQGPMRIEEVTDLLEEWEVKKQLDIEKVHRVRFLPETIQKAKNDERYVLGIVLEPEVKDAQGDIYSADEIKQACHKYMAKWRNRGFMHRIPVNDSVDLVENIFVHPEMVLTVGGTAIMKGTWLAGFHLHGDEYWNKTQRGEITGLSIGGTAEKEPVK